MNKREENLEFGWLDNVSSVVDIIVLLVALTIILSQSFALNNGVASFDILRNVINHNSIYLIILLYFISLKTNFGKKYFNYFNLFLIILYFINSVTSLLTVLQSFNLVSIIGMLINLSIFTYLFHTLLKGTRLWKEFGIQRSPFNDITNEAYFYIIIVLAVIALAINLLFTTSFGGTVLTMLDAIYVVLFARYIYLYGLFIEENQLKTKVEKKVKAVKKKIAKKTTSKNRGDK